METPYKQSQVKNSPVQECVSDIHKQTNQSIYDRNIPSEQIQPYLNVSTVKVHLQLKVTYHTIKKRLSFVYNPIRHIIFHHQKYFLYIPLHIIHCYYSYIFDIDN